MSHWSDVTLPPQGRLFVALASTEGLSPRVLKGLPDGLKICIAAAGPLPLESHDSNLSVDKPAARSRPEKPSGFAVCATPPPHTWVDDMLDWVAARVPPGGGFNTRAVRRLFDGDAALVNSFETPGALLSFLGLVDEIGLMELPEDQAGLDMRWVRVWLKAALERVHQ